RRLNARWDRRIIAEIRAIVRTDESASKRVQDLSEYVRKEGLPVPENPEPLPPIDSDDIRLVCWMAVEPTAPTAPEEAELAERARSRL
ncbi:MAG TPA: hypothetical protein VFN21_02825, partial [Acidimicrobiales bacterium]|nr:hypothetical protein [Acidimicrobiales bacterium]